MRVFVAGASGAIGTHLVPQLVERNHEVFGTFRSPANAERVRALGAKPKAPRHFPVWLAPLFAGAPAVMMGTDSRGASNAKAKRELGWRLRYPSWRQGFAQVYGEPKASKATPAPTHPFSSAAGGT